MPISKNMAILVRHADVKAAQRSSSPSMRWNIMSSHRWFAGITVALLFVCSGLYQVEGLKCYMCGQYNEGVGSITPCLNYSEKYAPLYLKECSKKTEKYCVKYVSELSTVRDCATECTEKEIWETQTYCCNEDGCNGSIQLDSSITLMFVPMILIALVVDNRWFLLERH